MSTSIFENIFETKMLNATVMVIWQCKLKNADAKLVELEGFLMSGCLRK